MLHLQDLLSYIRHLEQRLDSVPETKSNEETPARVCE